MSEPTSTPPEDRPLEGLPPLSPPPALEDAVVARLRDRGLLRESSRSRPLALAWAASILVALLVGAHLGPAPDPPVDPNYLLLLSRTDPLPPAELEARVAEYGAWARDLHARGALVAAARLEGEGWSLGDGAPAASGYFLLVAESEEEARRLARDCPHLRHGGAVRLHALGAR